MTGKKMLMTVRIITKVLGSIFLAGGIILLVIGGILRLIMGPVVYPEVDDIMMIGIAALIILFQYIPNGMMILGGFFIAIGILHLVINGIIVTFIDLDIMKQKAKSYLLVICSVLIGIIILPAIFFICGFIFNGGNFAARLMAIFVILNIYAVYGLMLAFVLIARRKVLDYHVASEDEVNENVIDNVIM